MSRYFWTFGLRLTNVLLEELVKYLHDYLTKTLGQFFPLIRFVEISRTDFFDKVRPYDSLCKFKLIYRGIHDGINDESFKKKCKGRVASLVLIKVKNTNKIFGGYSSIGFNPSGSDLVLENSNDIKNMKINHVLDHDRAILNPQEVDFGFDFVVIH
ncbi:hypothetical protein GLOIN_2v1762905 [Rhizophagus clarus]|uniref:TLDc domain-containing protein n=1 Tax=Rhizophagus clarus TaxID=94130 RepID=A0A8H3LK92_9GLOM|nr:hypothetical protein GLOIN_2v1762905 [Rhizophagus clarus]